MASKSFQEKSMSKKVKSLFLLASFLFISALANAQPNTDALRYRYIGPVGNRVTSIAGVPGQPNIYYTGSASGGIFKTTDGGAHLGSDL